MSNQLKLIISVCLIIFYFFPVLAEAVSPLGTLLLKYLNFSIP